MLHGHLVIPTTNLNCHSVVLKPSWLRLTGELADSCCQPEIGRNHYGSDSSAETFRTRNMHSTARRRISIESTSMGSVPVDQALHDNGSRVEAWFSGVDWNSSPRTELTSVILLPRSVRPTPRRGIGHSMPIISVESVAILISPILAPFTPRRRSGAVSRLNRIRSDGSTVNSVARLRHGRILISCCPEQIPDLHQASASFRLRGLDGLCNTGRNC